MYTQDKGTSELSQEALSPKIRELLDFPEGSNSDWASAPVSIALAVMNAGGTEEDYSRIVQNSALGESAKRPDQMLKRLDTAWAQAEELYDPGYSNNILSSVLDTLAQRVSESPEFNRGQRLTALALVDIAREVGAYSVDASARRMSLLTGFSADTSARHLRALAESDLVSRVVYNGRGKARSFVLNLGYYDADIDSDPSETTSSPVLSKESGIFWTRFGAGPTAQAVYEALDSEPATITAVAESAGVSHATAKRYIELLFEQGLAGKDTSSRFPRWFRTEKVPDSAECETAQRERAEKYEEERRFYREEQAQFLEEALANTDFLHPGHLDLAFTPEQIEGKLYWQLEYRLSEKGRKQAREQGWVWRHCDIPEEFREYRKENPVPNPWATSPTPPKSQEDRPTFRRGPFYSGFEPGMTPFAFGPRSADDLEGAFGVFDWFQPPRKG